MIRRILICIISALLLLGYNHAQAQRKGNLVPPKAKDELSDALRTQRMGELDRAEKHCRKVIELAPNWEDGYDLLSTVLRQQGKNEEALQVDKDFIKAIPTSYAAYMNAANICMDLGRFDEALGYYQQAAGLESISAAERAGAQRRARQVGFASTATKHPVPFQPENMGPAVNTRADEYLPTFTVDGQTMYFTRRKIADTLAERNAYRYSEDIMMSQLKDGKWQPAVDVPGINTIDNEGAMCIAPDGSYMIFTGCGRADGQGGCDLYIAFNKNGKWTHPVNMGAPINTRWKETQPSISYDGYTIYFSSNRPGTVGGQDLWMSTRDDNWNFAEPVNLGPVINTTGDEQTPFIHPDNNTLYFCSNGHPGMGMNDLFVSHRKADGQWDSAVNLGYPINTPGDEPGLVVEPQGRYAYYSNQLHSYGGLDLVRFELPKYAQANPVTYLKGNVFDFTNKQPLQAELELVDLSTGQTALKSLTDEKGQLLVALPEGKDYMVNVAAEGYLFYSAHIPLKDYKKVEPYQQDIGLHPIKPGEKITLNNVFFPSDGYTLKKESQSELKRLVSFMLANPKIRLEIGGHTDNTGTEAHNQSLSQNRARAVYDFLVNEGKIPAARLSYKGYGATQPVASNNTEAGKAQNRRTEVRVIE